MSQENWQRLKVYSMRADIDCDFSVPLKHPRWEAFAQILFGNPVNHRCASEAYVQAGYKPNTPNAAWAGASRLLSNVKVAGRLEWLEENSLLDKRKARLRLLKNERIIQETTLAHFFDVDQDGQLFCKVTKDSLHNRALRKAKFRRVNDEHGNQIIATEFMEIELEPYATSAKAERDMLGLDAPSKHEHTGKGGGPLEHEVVGIAVGPLPCKTVREWEELKKHLKKHRSPTTAKSAGK